MANQVTVTRILQVSGGHLAQPWLIKNAEELEGLDFAKMDKNDSGWSRYILGKSKGRPLTKYDFFERLRLMRNISLKGKATGAKRDGTITRYAWRKSQKKVKIEAPSGQIVDIPMPSVEYDGVVAPATVLRVKRPAHLNEAVQSWGGYKRVG